MTDSINALHGDQVIVNDIYDPVSADAQAVIVASVKCIRWAGI
jgi:hypothetical protein